MIIFWWTVIGVTATVFLVSAIVRYRCTKRHEEQPLSEEDRKLCAEIVGAGLGKPWICRHAIDSGKCPCLPCSLLEKARRGTLDMVSRRRSA